jgi:hypothetical protein
MRVLTSLGGLAVLAVLTLQPSASPAKQGYGRQYYSPYRYNEVSSYYYCRYYYQPVVVAEPAYSYHYVVYYPATPTYYYYYNPVRQVYWGRFEVDKDGKAKGYSKLAEKDQKKELTDIPNSAFPEPGKMPAIPEAKDGEQMKPPPLEVPKDKKD